MGKAKSDAAGKPRVPRRRKTKAAPEPRGPTPGQLAPDHRPAAIEALERQIEEDGGTVIGSYRDPLGGHWQIVAGLPIDRVQPTPYQRDLSEPHVVRLAGAIEKLGGFVDPVVAVRAPEGGYWTPNGNHRLAALRTLGARSVVAIVVPEPDVAHRILVLNTEKAHNVRERALEVIRLAEALAQLDDRAERDYAIEFEEPALLTLGACYLRNGRFSGGAYQSVLKRVEAFTGQKLSKSLELRRERADRLLELDGLVAEAVAALKARGFESPYLKAFVLARINPLRFQRGAKAEFDETVDKMVAAVRKFDAAKIRTDQVARAGGAPDEG